MSIKPGEKIGMCGRTGSGKTSLTLAPFRMTDIQEGSIKIDGLDITSLDPNGPRSGLNDIPQEAYFMAGTALTSVHLAHVIREKGGLNAELGDELLSQGKKQLFCLARMLKSNKILLFGEATSNSIDVEAETLIKKIIEEEFKDYTVITIAHRLTSILGSGSVRCS
ncbi:hypothetical protein jhhlp_007556 [Lomentospora prolificans]|uniref:ABC transporter domain-containing protein n=1 Tax=Lomentospora prolificans TaxID=41688 RepID=A0A2N3MZW6_9PEZI|nr:hypothetical protein jhhlp_007556 [Lomentospora prolificans]